VISSVSDIKLKLKTQPTISALKY